MLDEGAQQTHARLVGEALASVDENWVAIGTQFHPEAETASALDVKIFEEFVVGITGEVPEVKLVA